MMPTMILTVLLMILASAEQPAATQPQTQPAPPGPAAVPSEEDAEFASLRKAFGNLYSSLRARGGIADEDLEVVRSFRDRVATFNERWPDHEQGLAMELQLSGWLKDYDRVHQVFARLAELRADDFGVGLAWANYFVQINDRDRAEEIFARLAELYSDNVEVRLVWVEYLRGFNQYGPAIEILRSVAFNLTELPRAALLLSECLFAEHRFQEALDVLLSISQETRAEDVAVSQQVQAALPDRQEYVELWVQEQEIRLAEEVADDLPRAELITARGRIVVELFENEAPNTVANFVSLAEAGFYDGSKFHRVIPNFMAQGGDPNSKPGGTGVPGKGSPGYRIPDEHDRAGARNHFTGSLAMAKTAPPHTAGCQFYLTHTPPARLNGNYTVFGRVIEGLEVVRSIELDDVLESVSVLRKRDHEYSPQTLPLTPTTQPALRDGSATRPATTRPSTTQPRGSG
ncbi:MAG: peptidylprolyl isomerase [Planctomycetota bacterium]|nr:peptidylprolyl isomerase [Planctomycetota bacterium]